MSDRPRAALDSGIMERSEGGRTVTRVRVGRFTIERQAGAGGMGTIFRAHDDETGQPVALKLTRELREDEQVRFQREGRALARLRHPGIVRYVDHGVAAEGEVYLAMEWLDGEDLRSRLRRSGLTVRETVTLGRCVAEALVALHAEGLVHRDLKPSNIFLVGGRADDVRVIDFGLVRGHDATADLTRSGIAVGTPAYMSPEQARGQPDVDPRSDLFSLGCVLFKCLTGRAPFEGTGLVALLTKMILEDVPRVRSLRPDVPPAVDEIVAQLTSKDPAGRFQTALELATVLTALEDTDLDGGEVSASASSPGIGLTAGEQRVVAMVLVGPAPAGDAARIASVAAEHRGHVDPILDGTRVITFQGPSVATDQAARAAQCALAVRAVVPGVPIAVAMEWSELHASTPAGAAIERAAALLERGPPSTIVVDALTAALLDARFEVREGASGMELVAAREVESGIRELIGRHTPFVGREWEMGSVLTLLRDVVEASSPRAVLVTGPAGMGKSRLLHEIAAAARRDHPELSIWSARGDSLRAGSPFGLLGQALRSALGLRRGAPVEEQRRLLEERVAAEMGVAASRRAAMFLGEIVGTPYPDDLPELGAARDEAAVMVEQIRRAFRELLAAFCDKRPLLLVLEDLQWGDLPTVRLVDEALGAVDRLPWMVLGFARPEVHAAFPRLWASREVQEIRLKPLSRKAGEQIVRHVLGDRVDAAATARLLTQADGNAFYLEELIRAVDARGGSASGTFPETVLAMAHARFAALDPSLRRLLRAASVFGEVFWPGAVGALLAAEPGSASFSQLLTTRELVVRRPQSRFTGEEELAFRHTLVREAAYAALTPGDRALGHLLAGNWLEARGEADALLLAHHFDLGGDAHRASVHYLHAARQALVGLDLRTAAEIGEKALAAASSPAARVAAADLLGEVAAWRFDWPSVMVHVETVLALADRESKAWIRAAGLQQSAGLLLGRPDAIVGSTAALLAYEPSAETLDTALHQLTFCVFVLCLLGQRAAALAALGKLDALAAPVAATDPLARAHQQMGHVYPAAWLDGDPWATLVHAEAARAAYVEGSNLRDASYAACYAGLARLRLGLVDEAERVLRAIPGQEFSLVTLLRDGYLLTVLVERGALDEARVMSAAHLERARRMEGPGRAVPEGQARSVLAAIALRTGDPETAAREAALAVEGGLRNTVHDLPAALAVLAQARLALGQPAEALAAAREAVAILGGGGGSLFRAPHVRLAHAEALHATGDLEGARAAIADARARLLAIAARIDDPAVRRSFLENVPTHARTLALARAWLGEG